MPEIVQVPDPVLKKPAEPVASDEIQSQRIQDIITRMKAALHDTDDGVAIAAPQIGESVRIFLVRDKVFEDRGDMSEKDTVFINPEIINTSSDTVEMTEGCLSLKHHFGKTERSRQATVQALDETGQEFTLGGSGLLAQIFQHEIDHLDGIVFTDHARDVQDIRNRKSETIKANIHEE